MPRARDLGKKHRLSRSRAYCAGKVLNDFSIEDFGPAVRYPCAVHEQVKTVGWTLSKLGSRGSICTACLGLCNRE
jgi:hypothetical protein